MEENSEFDGDGGRNSARYMEEDRYSIMDIQQSDSDEEEQPFDITLAASHSYMGPGLVAVRGEEVVTAGWRGVVPVVAHHGAVFPGETVPLLLPRAADAPALAQALREKRMFALLCPNESGLASGYGVLCEVYEAGGGERSFFVKARANHRFRFVDMPKKPLPLHHYTSLQTLEVEVLGEGGVTAPLEHARLYSLDSRRPQLSSELRRLEAAVSSWPMFLYDMFDYTRMRDAIKKYFSTLNLENLPSDPVELSFWVASNLQLTARDRLSLLLVDSAMHRLTMELRYINKKSTLCCGSCLTEIARRENIFAMSSEGVHSNYTNLGGFMHDVVTVSSAGNVVLDGGASAQYSWFPGYTWTIALCRTCASHVGWRFDAMKRKLRPQQFFGLCRNQVRPVPAVLSPSTLSDR